MPVNIIEAKSEMRKYIGDSVDRGGYFALCFEQNISNIRNTRNTRNTRYNRNALKAGYVDSTHHIYYCILHIKHYPGLKEYIYNFLKNTKEVNMNNLLYSVCSRHHNVTLEIIQFIIDQGANINEVSPLHRVVGEQITSNTFIVMDLLLRNGASINKINPSGSVLQFFLQYCDRNTSEKNYKKVIMYLLLNGANYENLDLDYIFHNKEYLRQIYESCIESWKFRNIKPAQKA